MYYVMPFIEGESLGERIEREGRMGIDSVLQITREVASALTYASGKGVIHRDIKPDNIMLNAEGHAVVMDFGIGKALEAGGQKLTQTGMSVGTPAYMSPEQAMGEGDVDGRTDVLKSSSPSGSPARCPLPSVDGTWSRRPWMQPSRRLFR